MLTKRHVLLVLLLVASSALAAHLATGWPVSLDRHVKAAHGVQVGVTTGEALNALGAEDMAGRIGVVMMADPKWGGWTAAPLGGGATQDQLDVLARSPEWFFTEPEAKHEWFEVKI